MKDNTKIVISIILSIIVSLIGYGLFGLKGCFLGFILTLFLIGLFHIWRKDE
jgi:predicted PurR-regulated permease PerM